MAKDFQNVDDSLSQNLSKIIFDGPLDELTFTENAQPAIMTVSIAILEVLKREFGFNIKKEIATQNVESRTIIFAPIFF